MMIRQVQRCYNEVSDAHLCLSRTLLYLVKLRAKLARIRIPPITGTLRAFDSYRGWNPLMLQVYISTCPRSPEHQFRQFKSATQFWGHKGHNQTENIEGWTSKEQGIRDCIILSEVSGMFYLIGTEIWQNLECSADLVYGPTHWSSVYSWNSMVTFLSYWHRM